MRTVLCDAHLELHKNNVVAQIAGGLRRCSVDGRPSHDGKLASFYFRPHTQRPAVSQLVHRTPRLALAAWEARMTAPCRMHCTVTFGEALQPSSLPSPYSLSSCVWNLFSGSALMPLCFSINSPLLHCLGPRGFAIESEKGHGTLQLACSIGLHAVSCRGLSSQASCREGRTTSPELPMVDRQHGK